MNIWDSDIIVQQWLNENDETSMPLPNLENEPHLLISKVRKYYMEYLIKLLSVNYENNQMLLNKNIYLPSAIWRCAKILEMSAAKTCMVVELYRQNIITVIKELKEATQKGKLFKQLYDCLRIPPVNEKKTQTNSIDSSRCNCQCFCGLKQKELKRREIPTVQQTLHQTCLTPTKKIDLNKNNSLLYNISQAKDPIQLNESNISDTILTHNKNTKSEVESSDDIMQQLDKLFHGIPDDDDIFDSILDNVDNSFCQGKISPPINNQLITINKMDVPKLPQDNLETTLEDRLAILSGIIDKTKPSNIKENNNKGKQGRTSKWLCEEYFLKAKLYERLDEIRETKRSKLIKIKTTMLDLFGSDSDDEGVVSPIDETAEFMSSCKQRIAPWVVKLLNPYYFKGRIRGKALFKSLAKHLIKLIYQCSKYPFEYEVESFVKDFLESHKMIRCEADFLQFTIENV